MAIGASIGAKLVSYMSSRLVEEGRQQQRMVPNFTGNLHLDFILSGPG
ncbi:MAG TPA: hypothetical protein VJ810_13555 [Blastocatellia bacterium]|nr:hypothetical protein [Blastocatellia bacterium]